MKFIKKVFLASLAFVTAAITPLPALAAGPDFSSLTSGIDLSTVETAIFAIGVSVMGLLIVIKGVKVIWSMFRGA